VYRLCFTLLALIAFCGGCTPASIAGQGAASEAAVDDSSTRLVTEGLARADEGDYTQAKHLLGEALALEEVSQDPSQGRIADILFELAWMQYRLGEYANAEASLLRARRIRESMQGPNASAVAAISSRLGWIYTEQGEYAAARPLLEGALGVAEALEPADPELLIDARNGLGRLAYYEGDFSSALGWFELNLAAQETLLGPDHQDVGKTLSNLGTMHQELGDYESAKALMQRALAVKRKHVPPTHPALASTMYNLANVHTLRGELDEAERLYEESLKSFADSLGDDHLNTAIVANSLGALYLEKGDAQQAKALLSETLPKMEQAVGKNHGWVAEVLISLGPVHAALQENELAESTHERAVAISSSAGEPALLWRAQAGYADWLASEQMLSASVFFGKQAVNTIQDMRAKLAGLAKPLQRSFADRRQEVYRGLADRLIDLGRLAEAQDVLGLLKEEEYFDFVRSSPERDAVVGAPVPYSRDETLLLDEFNALRERLADIERELAALERARQAGAEVHTLEQRVDSLRARAAEIQLALEASLERAKRLLAASPGRHGNTTATPHARQESSQRFPDKGTIVNYLIRDQRLRILVTGPALQTSRDSVVAARDLNRLVFEFREILQDPRSNPMPLAQKLYALMIEPIEDVLRELEIQTLEVSLDGALRYVPLAALHDGNEYLVSRFRFVVSTPVVEVVPGGAASTHWEVAGLGVSRGSQDFSPLPMVPLELESIVRRNEADSDGVIPGVIYLDAEFTRERFALALQEGYSLVHIATHFVFHPGRLEDSFLLLGDGEKLSLADLKQGDLEFSKVDMLTLSACETAMGVLGGNGAEIESFGTLAQKRGAQSVLATLWPVADRSTGKFMRELYRSRQQLGVTKAEALRLAQVGFIRGKHKPASVQAASAVTSDYRRDPRAIYAHPYYWAPFILMGDWL